MTPPSPAQSKSRPRLWRTFLHWPRDVERFAPAIPFQDAARDRPDAAELGHWGQVVLLSDYLVALHRDGTLTTRFHLVTTLHGERDLAEWDQLTRHYDARIASHKVRRAYVHLPEGGLRAAGKGLLQTSQRDRVITLAYAPLRPGVVVEIQEQYDQYRPFDLSPALWDQAYLEGPAPARRIRFTVAVAEPFVARVERHNDAPPPEECTVDGYHVLQWDVHDSHGIEHDEWTPHFRDVAAWVDVSTLSGWDPVARFYAKDIAPPTKTPREVAKLAHSLADGKTTDRERVQAIFDYAARDVRYGRHPLELARPTSREAGSVIDELRGDCKDKSALVVGMLRELDLTADIGLVLTRHNGRTPYLPGPRFDHAIVRAKLDDGDLWMDPAAGPFTLGALPTSDQGLTSLLLDGDTVAVPPAEPADHGYTRRARGRLEANGTLVLDVEYTTRGEESAELRTSHRDRDEAHRSRTLGGLVTTDLLGARVEDVWFEHLDDLEHDVRYGYTLVLHDGVRTVSDLRLLRVPWREPIRMWGPVRAMERVQPLEAPGVVGFEETHEISLPDDLTTYGLPLQFTEECRWVSYHCSLSERNGRLHVTRRVELRGGIIPADEFPAFKRFWETCARADTTDVVLRERRGSSPSEPGGAERLGPRGGD